MLKEMKKRVMQAAFYPVAAYHSCSDSILSRIRAIANRHVGQGHTRACAMSKAWKLVKAQAVSTRVVGTTFENRQNVLALLASYHPAEISVQLVRESTNPFDSNAVAVTAAVKGKVRAVIGYLPKAVASVIAALMDKGLAVLSDTLSIVGGYAGHDNYGARIVQLTLALR